MSSLFGKRVERYKRPGSLRQSGYEIARSLEGIKGTYGQLSRRELG